MKRAPLVLEHPRSPRRNPYVEESRHDHTRTPAGCRVNSGDTYPARVAGRHERASRSLLPRLHLTAERIKAVLSKKRDAGEYCGGTEPYGWRRRPDGTLEPETDEQETIAIAKDLHATGLSLRKIGARLLEMGRRPKVSAQWHARTVQSLLRAQVVA